MNIVYRATNLETTIESFRSFRPTWFDKRKCFKSLMDQLDIDDTLYIIFDGKKEGLYEYVKQFRNCVMIEINENSNEGSLRWCYDFVTRIPNDDLYFVEDDYLHCNKSLKVLKEGVQKFKLVTLYDHMDRYENSVDICSGKERIELTESCHWRTAESTTCTWACTWKMFEQIGMDAKRYLLNDRDFFRYLYNKNIRLWTPMPGKATHVVTGLSSPFTNWEEINKGIIV